VVTAVRGAVDLLTPRCGVECEGEYGSGMSLSFVATAEEPVEAG
jgi:hypothetical protein